MPVENDWKRAVLCCALLHTLVQMMETECCRIDCVFCVWMMCIVCARFRSARIQRLNGEKQPKAGRRWMYWCVWHVYAAYSSETLEKFIACKRALRLNCSVFGCCFWCCWCCCCCCYSVRLNQSFIYILQNCALFYQVECMRFIWPAILYILRFIWIYSSFSGSVCMRKNRVNEKNERKMKTRWMKKSGHTRYKLKKKNSDT